MKIKTRISILSFLITMFPVVAAFIMVIYDYYSRTEQLQLQSITGWLKENESSVNEFITYQKKQMEFFEDVYHIPMFINAVNQESTQTLRTILSYLPGDVNMTSNTVYSSGTTSATLKPQMAIDDYVNLFINSFCQYSHKHSKDMDGYFVFDIHGHPFGKTGGDNITTDILQAIVNPATGHFYYDFVLWDKGDGSELQSSLFMAKVILNEKSLMIGGIAGYVPLSSLDRFLDTRKTYPGQLSIFSRHGDYLFSDKKHNLKNITQLSETNEYRILVQTVQNSMDTMEGNASFKNKNGTEVLFNYIKLPFSQWLIVHSVTAQETGIYSKFITWKFGALAGFIVLLIWFGLSYINRILFVPIDKIISELRRIIAGKGTLHVYSVGKRTELTVITEECNKILDILRREREAAEVDHLQREMFLSKRRALLFEMDWEKRIIHIQYSKYFGILGLKEIMTQLEFEQAIHLSAYDMSKIRHQQEILITTGKPAHGEFIIMDEDENKAWWNYNMVARKDADGVVRRIIGICIDTTLERREHKRLKMLKDADIKNHVLTKPVFFTNMNNAIATLKNTNDIGALFFIGINNYRSQNTSFGYEFGDQMIAFIGRSLSEIIPVNVGFIGRHGGGEFYVFINDKYQVSYERLTQFAISIREQLNSGFKVARSSELVSVKCNIGIAIFPDDSEDFNELFLLANKAMQLAKNKHRTGIEFSRIDQES